MSRKNKSIKHYQQTPPSRTSSAAPNPPSLLQTIATHCLWGGLLISLLLACIYLSFFIVSKLDYSYKFWYETLNIDQTISTFGPQNRYKDNFENTDKAEHIRLFSEIVKSVHNQGKGLKDITYYTPDNKPIDTMLRIEEVEHLQDVATLIDKVNTIGLCSLICSLLLIALIITFKYHSKNIKRYFTFAAIAIVLSTLAIMLIGPKAVFYQLHIWLFPQEHQWFFYYQDSLMSTSMQAPILFGGIAVEIALIAFIIYVSLLKIISMINHNLKDSQ